MDFLILIKNGCDNLTATVAPSVDALGLHMVISLATIMLAWFGVQEALASTHGGAGFNISRFFSFFLLLLLVFFMDRFRKCFRVPLALFGLFRREGGHFQSL